MNASSPSSASASATMSPSAPAKPEDEASASAKSHAEKPGEADFVAQQAQEAKLAMQQVWNEIRQSVGHAVSIREATQRHPIIATSAAAVAGAALGYALTPRNRKEAHEMWEHLKAHLHSHESNGNGKESAKSETPPKPSLLHTIAAEAVKMMGPVLTSLVTAWANPPGPPPDGMEPDGPTAPTA